MSWRTSDDDFTVDPAMAYAIFTRPNRAPTFLRSDTVHITFRVPLPMLEWMDDQVAHRTDPLINSRSDLIRDALDVLTIFWKERDGAINSAALTRLHVMQMENKAREWKEFMEKLRSLVDGIIHRGDQEQADEVREMLTSLLVSESNKLRLRDVRAQLRLLDAELP